jgi:hypothetical protein
LAWTASQADTHRLAAAACRCSAWTASQAGTHRLAAAACRRLAWAVEGRGRLAAGSPARRGEGGLAVWGGSRALLVNCLTMPLGCRGGTCSHENKRSRTAPGCAAAGDRSACVGRAGTARACPRAGPGPQPEPPAPVPAAHLGAESCGRAWRSRRASKAAAGRASKAAAGRAPKAAAGRPWRRGPAGHAGAVGAAGLRRRLLLLLEGLLLGLRRPKGAGCALHGWSSRLLAWKGRRCHACRPGSHGGGAGWAQGRAHARHARHAGRALLRLPWPSRHGRLHAGHATWRRGTYPRHRWGPARRACRAIGRKPCCLNRPWGGCSNCIEPHAMGAPCR